MANSRLGGVLVSVPLPLDEHGALVPSLLGAAIQKLRAEGCDGMYLFGTSGEGYAVSDAEFAQIAGIFAAETAQFAGFRQVGCFGLSSEAVKLRCQTVANLGLEGVQITLPFWKELNDAEIARYFTDVCGSFPNLSFLLYNNPRNKRRLKGAEMERMHQLAPNLEAAKTGSGAWLDFYELITEAPSIHNFVTEAAFAFCHPLGAAGLIPSANYALPALSRGYYDAVVRSDASTASRLHADVMRFFHLTAVPLVQKGYIDGAIDKAYARLGGMDMPLNMKSPHTKLSDADYAWLSDVMNAQFAEYIMAPTP